MLKIRDTLWLRIRFNNAGDISAKKHKYIVANIDDALKTVEVLQLDTVKKDNMYKATRASNMLLKVSEKDGINKMCYVQLDNVFLIESGDYVKSVKTGVPITEELFEEILAKRNEYCKRHTVDGNKMVYMTDEEITGLNK